jgi:hypothetical protein
MDDQNTPDRSPNVGAIRWLGAKSVVLLCQTCRYQQVANVELLPDDFPLALVASKFVCRSATKGASIFFSAGGCQRQLIRQHDERTATHPARP